jgi:chromosome partitioning protein
MRGRRRGRNRSSVQDEQDATPQTDNAPGGGSVKLVETSTSLEPEAPDPPLRPDPPPDRPPESTTTSAATPLKETSSDVATAHAELDSVLPPAGDSAISNGLGAATPVAPAADSAAPAPAVEVAPAADSAAPAPAVEVAPAPAVEAAPPPAAVAGDTPVEPEPVLESDRSDDHPSPADPGQVAQAASGNPLPRVMAVANQKGGVGKTTTSVNLGAALAEIGFRVLVIDLDPQGNATTGLGIDARSFELSMYDVMMRDASLEDCVEPTSMKNLFVAPATIALAGAEIELVPAFSRELKLKRSIESVIDEFDYILIDCPPSLGLITVNALAAADEVLVPIQCEYYALEGLSQLMRNVHLVASNLNPSLDISTIVLTMYDARTKLSDQVASEVREHFGTKVCRNVIPRTVRLSEAPSFGQPITAFDPSSRGAIAYRELAKEVSGGTS